MKHSLTKLKNGLRVLTIPIPAVESATVMVMTGVGSRYEAKSQSGISHFLEHMAFKGTKKRPSAIEIATLLDGIGAESNAFTSKEVTAYYVKAASDHVTTAFDVLSDIMLNSTFPAAELEKEKGVILEEFNMYEDMPMRKIGDVYENLMFGDQPLGWDILGDRDVIRGVTRDEFVAYMKKFYSPSNMVIVVAGNVKADEVERLANEHFSEMEKYETPMAEQFDEKGVDGRVLVKPKATEQTHFALGVRTFGRDNLADRYPLTVLSAILGGGMSSRLFHEVREKRGLAYYVRSIVERYLDTGYLAAFAGVDNARAEESIKIVSEQIEIAANGEFEESEVRKAREYVKGHFVLGLEDTGSVAVYYGMGELLDEKLRDPGEIVDKIEAVTVDDVSRVAKRYLSGEKYLALIGKLEEGKAKSLLAS